MSDFRAEPDSRAPRDDLSAGPPDTALQPDELAGERVPGELEPGDSLGPYRVLEELGRGGMGIVYLAEQMLPVHRRVALKVIKVGMDTAEVLARFDVERQAMAMMDHPNVARVLDGGATAAGRPYFVMDYVEGLPITEYCDRHRLGNRERLQLFVQVCRAIQHAHQKGIIHRDMKPSNVLVMEKDGTAVPKVIDFGIAKATNQRLTEKTLFTERGQLIGTPAYMSPEQVDDRGLFVDTRTDVYSLGILLYELLTGTLPFSPRELRRKSYSEIQHLIREVDPPRPSTRISTLRGNDSERVAKRHGAETRAILREVRGDLDAITLKALEKDRNRRYDTANALAADVERYLRHEPVLAQPPSIVYRTGKFVRRHRAMAVAVTATFVLAVALTASAFVMLNRKVAETTDAKEQVEAAKAQVEKENARMGALLGVLGATTNGTMIIDMQTKQMVDVNDECLAIFGYTREEFLRLNVMAITAEPEKTAEAFRRIAQGEFRTVERLLRKRNGEVFPAKVFSGKFTRDGRDFVIGEIQPIPAAGELASGGAE